MTSKKCNIVLLGDGAVGKSSLTLMFLDKSFSNNDFDPTIADSFEQTVKLDGRLIKMEIYDTSGQDEYAAMREQYLRLGDAFLLVFSVTDRRSFDSVDKYYSQIQRVKNQQPVPVILVGNKVDLQATRLISHYEAMVKASSLQIPYIETSAKTCEHVDDAFLDLVHRLIFSSRPQNGDKSTERGGACYSLSVL